MPSKSKCDNFNSQLDTFQNFIESLDNNVGLDILNNLMTRVIANVDGLEEANFIEQYHFSLYMVLTCVQFHIFASAMYIAKFEINAKKLMDIYKKSTNILIELTDNMEETIAQYTTVKEEV